MPPSAAPPCPDRTPRSGNGIICISVSVFTLRLRGFRSLVFKNLLQCAIINCLFFPVVISLPGVFFLGSREAAFVYAISSAGVVYALTRACSQGELKNCNCDPHKRGRSQDDRGEFDWGGCSDNINYGIKFAKTFIDARERTVRDARALMNLHNNRCGRTVSVDHSQ